MMKFDRHTHFLKPFIESVSDLVDIERIKKVKGYWVDGNKDERQLAAIHRLGNNKDYYVTIKVKVQKFEILKNGNRKFTCHIPDYLANILSHLAHELAHVKYWEHDYKHFRLEAKIMYRFSKVLKLYKIDDTYQVIRYIKYKKGDINNA